MSVVGIPQVHPDLYTDTYYYDINGTEVRRTQAYNYATTSPFCRVALIILLRAGLILIQLGSIPVQNTNLILMHNSLEMAVATISYGLIGYMLSYGTDYGRFVGLDRWLASEDVDLDKAITGWMVVITCTGIFTTMVAGRMHMFGYMIVTIVLAAFVEPMIVHWIWTRLGFMHKHEFIGIFVSYKDMGGGAIVHVMAGGVATIAMISLGRRLMRLRDVDVSSLPPSAPATATLGYVLLILGLLALCMPSQMYEMTHPPGNYTPKIIMNNVMAIAGGMLAVIICQFSVDRELFHYWINLRCMQGAVAGMVYVSAGVDVYTPLVAFCISLVGGVIFYFVAKGIFSTSLEDYCSIIAIHFVCGFIGTILPPLLGNSESFGFSVETTKSLFTHLCWQFVCGIILFVVIVVIFVPIFGFLYCLGFLHCRTSDREHRRALMALDRGPEPTSFTQRLFPPGDDYIIPGFGAKGDQQQGDKQTVREHEVSVPYFNKRANSSHAGSLNKGDDVESVHKFEMEPNTTQAYRMEVELDQAPLAAKLAGGTKKRGRPPCGGEDSCDQRELKLTEPDTITHSERKKRRPREPLKAMYRNSAKVTKSGNFFGHVRKKDSKFTHGPGSSEDVDKQRSGIVRGSGADPHEPRSIVEVDSGCEGTDRADMSERADVEQDDSDSCVEQRRRNLDKWFE